MNTKSIEDRILLKELIDKVSILGDQKDFNNQVKLFTAQAISKTIAEAKVILELKGREIMAQAFSEFLKEVSIVHHFNGQSLFNIEGNTATGICYCLITLISSRSDKKNKTTIGAVYHDRYVRLDNRWLIEERISDFVWQDKSEVK